MTDITMLGLVCLGLGAYCLHLQWKVKFLFKGMQAVLEGIHDDLVIVEKKNGVYYPKLK